MADEVAQNTFASQASFYKDAADALRKFKDVIGIKSPKDAEEQEARILNLRRQAQAESDKDKTIVVQFGSAEEYSE